MTSTTVLLAEPDSATRASLRARLEANGFTVLETTDGPQAFAMANRGEIGLVIADLYMAVADDRCLVHAIRSAPALKRTRVLAYTSHGQQADRDWALRAGADGYVIKRSGEERLMQVALRLASRSSSRMRKLRESRKIS